MSRSQHRQELISTAHQLASRGWVANHDGNLTIRLASNRILASPTATAKADISDKNLIEVDAEGTKVAGSARPFGELKMHLAVYAARSDVGAVLHAHPPYATALACTGSALIERPFIAEAIVSLGPRIPTLAFALPGPDSVEAMQPELRRVDAVLLANHGVFTWGPTMELALLRMELVEHLAKIATLAQATGAQATGAQATGAQATGAQATGSIQPLPQAVVDKLLAARAKANLGYAADRAMDFVQSEVVACAPAPHAHASVKTISSHSGDTRAQLSAIIKEELAKVLR